MSKNTIKDTDLLYLGSVLRAREAKMMTRDKLERLLDASDYDDAAKIVADNGYPDMSGMSHTEIDNALGEYAAALFNELSAVPTARPIIDIFRSRYDYHNIKVLVKAMGANAPGDHLLSKSGRVPAGVITEAFNTGERRDLPEPMRHAISHAVGILSRTSDPQLSDIDVDRRYFAELLDMANAIGSSFVTGYVQLLIDSANLRTLVRTLRMKKDAGFLKNALIDNGTVRKDRLLAVSPSGEELRELFTASVLEKAAELGADAVGGGSLTWFELSCDNAQILYLGKAKLVSFGSEPVVAFVAAAEAEILALRMI